MMTKVQTASPYVGPRPFEETEEDQQRFFGRDREASDLLSLVIAHRVILVYAESGAGKTSLLNAKLIPMLKEEEDFDVLPIGRVQGRIPPGIPTEEISNLYVFNVLLSWAKRGIDPRSLFRSTLCDYLNGTQHATNEQGLASPRVVIFDQFEELFTAYPERWRDRKQFFQQIVEALDADPLLRVVFIMREDYLAQLDPYVALLPEKLRTRYRLERLQEDAALLAVKGPLRRTDRDFASGAAETLVKELLKARIVISSGELEEVEGQYVEPAHLQVVCQRLWATLPPEVAVIEAVHLHEFGDVDRALVDYYADALQISVQRTGIDEAALRDWFGRILITPMGTRGTVYRDEQKGRTGDIPNAVVDVLVDQHIIRAEYRAGIRWYELTHDRFIEPILASNAEWFETWRQTNRDPLTDAVREWKRLDKDEGSLFGGAQLDEAIAWAKQHAREVDDLEQEFLDASIALRERIAKEREAQRLRELEAAQKLATESDARREAEKLRAQEAEARAKEQARSAKVLTLLAAALVVALLVAVWALFQANYQRNEARKAEATARAGEATAVIAKATEEALKNAAMQAQATAKAGEATAVIAKATEEALKVTAMQAQATAVAAQQEALGERDIATSRRLAAQSISSQESDPQLSLLLAVEAFSVTHTTAADDAIRQALQASRMRAILSSHTGRVNGVAFSPDGKLLATGSADGTARLWEVDGGGERALFDTPDMDSVVAVAFSPNSRWLATASADGAARVWEVANPKPEPIELEAHAGQIDALAYSPDGRWLVTASADKTGRIWDAQSPEEPIILQGHTDSLNAVALSPESRRVATASLDGTARLWDLETGRELAVLRDHASGVNALAFSPDGRQLATASIDGTARLWDADSGDPLAVLRGHGDSVVSVAFSPDGSRLATASADGTARLWDAASAEEPAVLSGHADRVNSVAFSADGRLLATASADGTARLWDGRTGELQTILKGHASSVNVVVFSPDGAMLATASSDGTARLWEATGGEAQTIMRKHEASVSGLAFSPDGTLLATGGEDGRVHLWDAATILGGADRAIEEKVVVNSGTFYRLTFSPDGRLLATGHDDGAVRVWDVRALLGQGDSSRPVAILHGHNGTVIGLNFSPDGRLLASAEEDGTDPHLWDLAGALDSKEDNGGEVAVLEGHTRGGYVAFSPDGVLLATTDLDDNVVRLWNVADAEEHGNSTRPIATFRSDEGLSIIAFSPDGNLLAAGSVDGPVYLWDVSNVPAADVVGGAIAILRGHTGFILGVAFSPDGKLLATASRDRTARLWDLARARELEGRGAEVSLLRGHEGEVRPVAFSPEGEWLVTGSSDTTVRVWPVGAGALRALACDRATRNFTLPEWETYDVSDRFYRKTCSDLPIHPSVIDAKLRQGQEYARQGNIDEALAAFAKAKELDPSLTLTPEAEVADLLVAHGRELASQGDVEEALAALRQAKELDPELETHQPLEMARLYHEVCGLASDQDNLTAEVMDICRSAVTLAAKTDDAYLNFGICRLRAIAQLAEMVEPACGRASELAKPLAYGETVTGTVAGGSGGIWTFENDMVQVATVAMNQEAGELDSYLTLVGPTGDTLTEDDDSGGNLNARISDFVLYETGVYIVVARGLGDSAGAYTLSLNREAHSARELADLLVAHGRELASQGNTDEALATLAKAKELDPSLTLAPEAEVARLLVEHGRELASQGDTEEALATLAKAKELDPSLAFVPEAEVALVQGRMLASQGNVEEALAALRKSKELDPELETHRPLEMARLYHEVCGLASDRDNLTAEVMDICRSAVTLAVKTDDAYLNFRICEHRAVAQLAEMVEPACSRAGELANPLAFGETVTGTVAGGSGGVWTVENDTVQAVTLAMNQEAGELDSYLTLVGPTGATLAEDDDSGGGGNARIGDFVLYETGVYTVVARGWGDSTGAYTLSLNREARSARELAGLLVEQGRNQAPQGHIDAALASYAEAQRLDSSVAISADAWNGLCWFGSLYDHAAAVLDACEQAVRLEPEHGGIRDSRGLARALTGDVQGAIQDFEAFVQWSEQIGGGLNVEWRREWIVALKAGQNPFDEATLQVLRYE